MDQKLKLKTKQRQSMDKSNNKHVLQGNDQVVFDFARPYARRIPCNGVYEMLCTIWYHLYN